MQRNIAEKRHRSTGKETRYIQSRFQKFPLSNELQFSTTLLSNIGNDMQLNRAKKRHGSNKREALYIQSRFQHSPLSKQL